MTPSDGSSPTPLDCLVDDQELCITRINELIDKYISNIPGANRDNITVEEPHMQTVIQLSRTRQNLCGVGTRQIVEFLPVISASHTKDGATSTSLFVLCAGGELHHIIGSDTDSEAPSCLLFWSLVDRSGFKRPLFTRLQADVKPLNLKFDRILFGEDQEFTSDKLESWRCHAMYTKFDEVPLQYLSYIIDAMERALRNARDEPLEN